MKSKVKTIIQFVIDPHLIGSDHSNLILRVLEEEKVEYSINSAEFDDLSPVLFFIEKKNLKKVNRFKNKIIAMSSLETSDNVTASFINFSSYEEITFYIKKIVWAERHLQIQDQIRKGEERYDEIKNFLERQDSISSEIESQKYFGYLLDLEILLLQEDSVEGWNIHFCNFVKNNYEIKNVLFIKSDELSNEKYLLDENVLILKIPLENYYIYLYFNSFDLEKHAVFIDLLLTICLRGLQVLDQKLVKNDGEVDLWKKVFSKIPYPMAIISNLGDLLIYNESFAKIGILPKECLRFKDHESTEIFQSFYKIRRIDFSINLIQVSYFVFYVAEKDNVASCGNNFSKKSSGVDDLGIISSSIAHELNNPLAGILAALSLLSLEDDWDADALSDLEDMKSGAKRCKELIEIFLGFSKFSPEANSIISIRASLDQAINLLRFRMIESNLRVDVKYLATLESFSHRVNSSILSMIFYLILSELMTAFAHHRLLTMGGNSILSGEILEFSNQIILKLEDGFEYEDKIAQSKLIQHLLIFEKIEINFLKQEIRLIYRF